jgi:hypothetical protein
VSIDTKWSLLSPEGQPEQSDFQAAGRSAALAGKTIGLFWNGKPGGEVFLDEVGRQLQSRFEGARVRKIWEERADTMTSYGNSEPNLEYMARSHDVVVAASAD